MPSYSQSLMILGAAILLFALIYLSRRRWRWKSDGIQGIEARGEKEFEDLVVPLMVYEEDYPAFGRIVSLVLGRFSLRRFLQDGDFRRALEFLSRSAFREGARKSSREAAMSVVVKTFVFHPDVRYHCGDRLDALVDEFLAELDI